MGKGYSYLVRHSIADRGKDAVHELVTHGVEDKHLVLSVSHLVIAVGAELTWEADQAIDGPV